MLTDLVQWRSNCIRLMLVLTFFVSTCSAYSYSDLIDNPGEISYVDDSTFIVTDSTTDTISYFYPADFGSSAAKVTGFTYVTDTVPYGNGYWLSLKYTGSGLNDVLAYDSPTGLQTYGDLELNTLAQINEGGHMAIDKDNNVYIACEDRKVYKINYPSYAVELLGTCPQEPHSIAVHPDGILLGGEKDGTSAGDANIYLLNDTGFHTVAGAYRYSTGAYVELHVVSLMADADGNIFASLGGSWNAGVPDFGSRYRITMINGSDWNDFTEITGNVGYTITDMEIDSNGIIYACLPGNGVINTYINPSGYGGTVAVDATAVNKNPSITWNQSSYSPGDTATLNFNVENPDFNEYSYQIRIGDTAGIKQTTTVTDLEENSITYAFSPTATASTYLAQILATNTTSGEVTILTGATASLSTTESYSISFSKDVYAYGDNMEIFYSGLPTNTQIYLRGTKSNPFEVVYTKSYYKTGSGSVILSVPSQTATDYAVYAIYQNYTLASDYCDVALSESQATLSGIVRDAETGARIEGAHVMLDGLGPYTDEVGSYSMIRDVGTYNMTVSAGNYHYYTKSLDLFNDRTWSVYLTPANFPGNLYGTVTDYATGERLSGVQITLKNSTATKTMLTGSGGFYSVEGLVNGTTYSFTAKLDGYDTYSNSSVDIDQVTWLDVKLIPEGYEVETGDDTASSDRPDRDAAEEIVHNWYEDVPMIFRLATLLFVVALVKRGTK